MSVAPQSRIAAVAIGNLIRTDDGVGIHALQKLQRDPRVSPAVTLIDGGTHGMELCTYLSDATHLLLLDAVRVGEAPGTILRFAGGELYGLPGGKTVHDLGLADLLGTLSLCARQRQEIILLGVEPGSTDWGVTLSPAVEAALGGLVDEAVSVLAGWSEPADAGGIPRRGGHVCAAGEPGSPDRSRGRSA